ncbi:ATP-dependent Clp protease ATP-binding subunit ClpX [hydrothermal vent metagenome]|uniref:ATP-dependent Clp protease ATP-binding subunit ClpX n=1 Tax=hydrothermal vent metagenome TaxID=652676 RepID=A0A3B1BLQ5_9ZZZZ
MRIEPTQVEVPKEEIDLIIERYSCSHEDAIKAYLTAKQASEEAYDETLGGMLGPPESADVPDIKLHTPSQIKEHLDKFVIGQEDYKKRLSIAAAYHFAIVKAIREGVADKKKINRFRKKNTLISGPSGSGKTYCAEILGDLLEVPTLIVDATDYTEAGYVGKSADDMIRDLIQLAPGAGKQEKSEFVEKHGGLIFIDEIDKKAKDGKLIGHDISREGFQRAVLKLIERKHISVDDPMSPASQIQDIIDQQRGMGGQNKRKGTISTENILFVLGGSFQRANESLEALVKKRIEKGSGRFKEDGSITITGFASGAGKPEEPGRNYYREAGAEDYIRFGLIPELVGRTPVRTYVNALSKNDLIRIMTETEDSILEQYKFEFSLFDIALTFDDSSLEWVAEKSENKKTGARALISVFEDFLTDFQFELPGRNFKSLNITREICEAPRDFVLEMLERSPLLDFIEKFKNDHGIELAVGEKVEEKIKVYAKKSQIPLSTALTRLLFKASALNYMDIQGKFDVTEEMIDNPKYFDDLYVKWHQGQTGNQKENG